MSFAACGDDDATTTADAAAGAVDAPASTALNGCNDADFQTAGTTIAFGGSLNLTYSPKCLLVTAGATVTFNGNFTTHPLSPGTASSTSAGSPGNPISLTNTGTTKTFTFSTAGTYPYICTAHASSGMVGAIKVQ